MTSVATQTDEEIEQSYFNLFTPAQSDTSGWVAQLAHDDAYRHLIHTYTGSDDVIVDEPDDAFEYEEVTLVQCCNLQSVGIRVQDATVDSLGDVVQVTQTASDVVRNGDILLQANGHTVSRCAELEAAYTSDDVTLLIARSVITASREVECDWTFDYAELGCGDATNSCLATCDSDDEVLTYDEVFNERVTVGPCLNVDRLQYDYEHLHTSYNRQKTDHQYQSMLPPQLMPLVQIHTSKAAESTDFRHSRSPVRTQLNTYQRLHSEPFTATATNDRVLLSATTQRLAGVDDDFNSAAKWLEAQQHQLVTDARLHSPRIVPKMGTKSETFRGMHNLTMINTTSSPVRTKSCDQSENRCLKTTECKDVNSRKESLQQQQLLSGRVGESGELKLSSTNKENVAMSATGASNMDILRTSGTATYCNNSPVRKQSSPHYVDIDFLGSIYDNVTRPTGEQHATFQRQASGTKVSAMAASGTVASPRRTQQGRSTETGEVEQALVGRLTRSGSVHSVSRLSQTDDEGMPERREAYARYAEVMYTNQRNLEHTIAVQQRLFEQLLRKRKDIGGGGSQLTSSATLTLTPIKTVTLPTSLSADMSDRQLALVPLDPDEGQAGACEQGAGGGSRVEETAMEWVVKRRADGSRYITRRPVKTRLLRQRARQIADERAGLTTDDDAQSVMKIGRYWNKMERRQQLDRALERKRRKDVTRHQQSQHQQVQHKQSPVHIDNGTNSKVATSSSPTAERTAGPGFDDASSSSAAMLGELMRKKLMKLKNKKAMDDFSAMQNMLSFGNRDTGQSGTSHQHGSLQGNALLSVTTV